MERQDAMAVVLFANTQTAIRAEQALQTEGIPAKLVPVPRQLSTECGLALRFARAEKGRVQAALKSAGVCYRGIHDL